MQQLMYANEVRSIKEIDIPHMDVKDAELKLAEQLIEQSSSNRFDPTAYHDDVTERIEKAVQKKVEGEEVTLAEPVDHGGGAQVIDLMEALRASLARKGGAAPSKEKEEAKRPARKAAKSAAAKTAEAAPRKRAKK
jgi:DNA end-binding protein Ku